MGWTLDYQGYLGISYPSLKLSLKLTLSQETWSLSVKCKLNIPTIVLCITLIVVVAGCARRPRL